MSKKVLITGVAGLLGSRLADWIVVNEPTVQIVGIDDLSGGYASNINESVQFNKLDLSKDTDGIESLFKTHQFDVVYHFAAYAAEALSPFIRTYNYNNNLISTSNLINASINNSIPLLLPLQQLLLLTTTSTPTTTNYYYFTTTTTTTIINN